ncbi:MAG: hypothetical protein J1F64_03390 [Oscillospiraceae bacterium]|nr:hypothetical protein [Oscillospiraceae bacterium]
MLKESDMYEPLALMLSSLGYTVKGEVKNVDITAVRGDETVIVEMKRNLSIDLLAQGLQRRKITDAVYVAIPKPKNYKRRAWIDIMNVMKKLELGLIFVTIGENGSFAQIVSDPVPYGGDRMQKRLKNELSKEFSERICNVNTGGVTRTKIATAYVEKAVHIACLLERYGAMSAARLKRLGSDDKKTYSILYKNYYGWFENTEKGIYGIVPDWREKAAGYESVIEYYENKVKRA